MTERDWLAGTDPPGLLAFLRGKVSDRKVWLLVSANWRRAGPRYPDPAVRTRLADIAERLADGAAAEAELADALTPFFPPKESSYDDIDPAEASTEFAGSPWGPAWVAAYDVLSPTDRRAFAAVLHDLFGNPYRPAVVAPRWATPLIRRLAQNIYDDRAFERLPALADALQEAGCENPDILTHCRTGLPHIKGCWVVDSILGKA